MISQTFIFDFTVPPKLAPMIFPNETMAGMRARTTCFVIDGDLPLTFKWLKDGNLINPDDDIRITKLDSYTSMLVIDRIEEFHTGNYTCIATNAAKVTKSTAALSVSGM